MLVKSVIKGVSAIVDKRLHHRFSARSLSRNNSDASHPPRPPRPPLPNSVDRNASRKVMEELEYMVEANSSNMDFIAKLRQLPYGQPTETVLTLLRQKFDRIFEQGRCIIYIVHTIPHYT